MTVKVVKLITGEQVVAQITEVEDANGEKVGFKMTFPYTVIMMPLPQEPGQPPKFDVNYLVWMSASSDAEFIIPYNSVIGIGNAAPEVEKVYMERFEEIMNESSHTT
jgi:hypothetical protein